MTTPQTPYQQVAAKKGWTWSPPHGGYINEAHRDNYDREGRYIGNSWASYKVADTAEEACFFDGIETEAQALNFLALEAA